MYPGLSIRGGIRYNKMNCELMLTYDTPRSSANRKWESDGSKNASHDMRKSTACK
jgi:hypothetical protein